MLGTPARDVDQVDPRTRTNSLLWLLPPDPPAALGQDLGRHLVRAVADRQSDQWLSVTLAEIPYHVLMAYSAHETRARQVPVIISNGSNEVKLTVDQTKPLPAGEHFQPIGTAELSANAEAIIRISNTDTTGFVIVDALRLVPM